MATNMVREGETIPFTSSGTTLSGTAIHIGGGKMAVALKDVADSQVGEAMLCCVWTLPKDGTAFTAGLSTFYLNSGTLSTSTAAGTLITNAYCFTAAGTGASTVDIKIIG